jgi:hypothetical protein
VWCWGDNTWGQLGEASMGGYSPVAVQVLDVGTPRPLLNFG